MKLKNWSNYPSFSGDHCYANDEKRIAELCENHTELIAQGAHKNYGDSAFAKQVVDMQRYDYLLDFDDHKGLLRCQSGVVFSDILKIVVPKGWMLPVVPGTKAITVGGAIASDIHGKNHHCDGCFSQYVVELKLMMGNATVLSCSPKKNCQLFYATCGGMGLTGVILEVTIQLMPIRSALIEQQAIKVTDLKALFETFEKHMKAQYVVAWIDALKKGDELGKGIVLLGAHESQGDLEYRPIKPRRLPWLWPTWLLNRWSIKVFNRFYYAKTRVGNNVLGIDQFFFPLDAISNWNVCYGSKGFVQYQCVIPLANSYQGISEILSAIQLSNHTPYLTVLKRLGPGNNNLLSFPIEGYTLTVDFKVNDKILAFLDALDKIVVKYGGRIYLSKDARMQQHVFDATYHQAQQFRKIREDNVLQDTFNSQQSRRLSL